MSIEFPSTLRMETDTPHVLIANNYRDQEFARKLATALRRDRVSLSTELGEMTVGDSLVRRLASTTRPVDCLVPIISVDSVTHTWVERDLVQVMKNGINRRRIRTYPAKVDNCDLPGFLQDKYVADFHGLGWNRAYDSLKAAIQRRTTAEPPAFKSTAVHPEPEPVATSAEPAPAPAGTKQLYLSIDYGTDAYYKEVLVNWSKMPGFVHFWVNDAPPAVSVDSQEAEPIKQALAKRIGAANGLLCVVGANCAANGWMQWEIKKADALGKRIIAVRISRECMPPELLSDVGATAALSFTFEGIRRAIDEAYGGSSLD